MTIQKKTALIFTGIAATILLVISSVAYFFMNTFAFQDYYKRLEIRGIINAKERLAHRQVGISELYSDIREQHLEALPAEKEFFFSADSLAAFTRANLLPELSAGFFKKLAEKQTANERVGNRFYTGFYYYDNGATPYIIIISAGNDDAIRYARKLRWIMTACCLGGIAVAYTSGIFFSKHAFKPVRDIIDKVKTIGVENLNQRLEDSKSEDEISELASTFNEMLSRLETAFETQNNFVSNASHEFRTPLTAIYGEAEIALLKPRENEEYRQALEAILNEAARLRALTDSLLNLAQTGFDGKKHYLERINVDDLLFDVKATINQIVPANNVQIDLGDMQEDAERPVIAGNYQLLKLGLSNVMENACKYSDNKPVIVSLRVNARKVIIQVRDEGIGIPREELKFIYDPFFRASNTKRYAGYGIGLPLTRNIFKLHKGEINVDADANSGTTVTLTLPLA